MAFFKRKPKIVDLSEHYHKQQEKIQAMKEESKEDSSESSTSSGFGFLGNLASSASSNVVEDSDGYLDVAGNPSEKRKRLAKRIMDMTTKMEDLSNQIYHLQQRIEVLERKLHVKDY